MSAVRVQDLRKIFGQGPDATRALDSISFEIPDGGFVSVVGPSGCGKTTLLNIVSGVEERSSGTVTIGEPGQPSTIGYVFQEPRLLPWRRIVDNITYVHSGPRRDARKVAMEYLEMVGLESAASKWPSQLSGGMQQRAGIARAFSVKPDLLLMDEPFSHLDAITARVLRQHLQEVWMRTRVTVLFVTHDIAEAVQLSDRIIVLQKGGRIRQSIDIDLEHPRSVADVRVATLQAQVMQRFDEVEGAESPAVEEVSI